MAQPYQLPFLIHEELRRELSEERAFKIAELLENSIGTVFESARELAVQKKVELRDELSKELASKGDLLLVKTELKADIAAVKAELKAEIASVKSELKADIASVRSELADMKSELTLEIQQVEARLDKKITIFSICIIFTILLTNKDAIIFLAQLFGLIK